MENNSQHFEKIEKSIWQTVLLAVVVILFLTLSLLGLQFYHYLEESQSIALTKGSYKYFVFLAIIILLFCSYMVTQHRRLSQLSRAFLREQEAVQVLSQDVKTLRSLFEVSSGISSEQKISDILHTITKEIVACFDADHASVMLIDPHSKTIETKVSIGEGSEIVNEAVIPMGESIAGYVVKSGKPLLLSGQVDPADFPGTRKKHRHITSSMCVPLKISGESIGVLNVNLVESDRSFSENDLKLIAIFANNAAVAINDARLYEQIKSFNVQLEEKVRERTRELEAANRVKSNFLASVSHELRTPLNAIVGFSKVLLEQNFGPLNEQQKKFAVNIASSGKRLDAIIDDILDVSKLETGDQKLSIASVPIKAMLETGFAQFKPEAAKKAIDFGLQVADDLADIKLNADKEKLKQVVFYLLSNAVKFTPESGAITLAAQRVAGPKHSALEGKQSTNQTNTKYPKPDTQKDFIEISVSDTGIGIASEDQKEVFKEFFQGKSGLSGKTPGTGMGLSLAKRLVELHDGSIWVESAGLDKGSRFAFTLPLMMDQPSTNIDLANEVSRAESNFSR